MQLQEFGLSGIWKFSKEQWIGLDRGLEETHYLQVGHEIIRNLRNFFANLHFKCSSMRTLPSPGNGGSVKGPKTTPRQVPALGSPQRRIPATPTPRCGQSCCKGSSCSGWRFCSPATAFAGVHVQLH